MSTSDWITLKYHVSNPRPVGPNLAESHYFMLAIGVKCNGHILCVTYALAVNSKLDFSISNST